LASLDSPGRLVVWVVGAFSTYTKPRALNTITIYIYRAGITGAMTSNS
jgi:hypothetical protein